ncbi:hypothetical protein [Paenibacillus sp. OSY-SE]|uniref:hypothetical protein n=1 Tax=Paenibacillus sp. OSY-SE TaxID=1196323 RepID=UPI00030E582B|nr:hypothetical protein [Paenibacillus sp. OSY-SE]
MKKIAFAAKSYREIPGSVRDADINFPKKQRRYRPICNHKEVFVDAAIFQCNS